MSAPQQPDDWQSLCDRYFDGDLTSDEQQRLNDAIKRDPAIARQFAQAMMFHDRLHAEVQAQAVDHESRGKGDVELVPAARVTTSRVSRWGWAALAAGIAVLVSFVFIERHGPASASAAVVALEKIIESAKLPIDRIYRVRVTDHGPSGQQPLVFSGANGRKPGVDGAELYVRGHDKFVLIRQFGNGTRFVTGCDGQIGWAVPPKGPIHVSRDLRRFRRAVPGEKEELPFVDMSAGFDELRRGYMLELAPVYDTDTATKEWHRFTAIKRAAKHRGPEEVRIWFDTTGVAHRIELRGLPPDEGGARSLLLELVEQRDLGETFFQHDHYHDAARPIEWE
ncbi:MAG: hypothetical protein JNM18_05645 [Planctomycetaceae bacterium]|nr:hypothetical protein [Planctomycetaceae bacterium]